MNRRDALKLSAAAALPSISVAQVQKGAAAAASATWAPSVLTPEQNDIVIALTDIIIPATDTPGAKAANVNRYIDLFLHDGPATERERFLTGLKWFEEYAQRTNGSTFVKLTPEKQISLLQTLDSANGEDLKSGNQFFRFLKAFTPRIYYNTEIGFRELNKGGVPGSFACSHQAH